MLHNKSLNVRFPPIADISGMSASDAKADQRWHWSRPPDVQLGVRLSRLLNQALRVLLKGVHNLLKLSWLIRRPRTFGAHAVALTPAARIILVKLRYADGWRLPGGGRKEAENPEDAVVRELTEEIGMTSYRDVVRACDLEEATDFKRDLASLLIVRDVEYQRPRWSWEVEDILETTMQDLPADVSPITAKWLGIVFPAS